MQQLFNDGLAKMQVADINARLSRQPIERYQWPLAAAILFFAIALLINDRKGTRAGGRWLEERAPSRPRFRNAGARAGVPPPRPCQSLFRSSPLSECRPHPAGLELYNQQKFPEAYEHFEKTLQENPGARVADRIHFDAGAAAYKMKDYNKALQSFSQALLSKNPHLQSESHYNLGNTLYERGEAEKSDEKKLSNWESALPHYEETLEGGTAKQERERQLRVRQKEDRRAKEETGGEKAGTKAVALTESFTLALSPAERSEQGSKTTGQESAAGQKRSKGSAAAAITEQRGEGQRPKIREEPKSHPLQPPHPIQNLLPGRARAQVPSPGEEKQEQGAGESPTPSPYPR